MLPGFTFGALLAYSAMAVPQVAVIIIIVIIILIIIIIIMIMDSAWPYVQMMVENSTGIVIDLYQVQEDFNMCSWL